MKYRFIYDFSHEKMIQIFNKNYEKVMGKS